MATSDKDKPKDTAAVNPHAQSAADFANSLSPEQRTAFRAALAAADAPPKPKPIVKKKFRVVAVRLGFDGLTLRHPGKKFTMDININDDWPDWVVKEEDYVPPKEPDADDDDEAEGVSRVQIRGGVKAGTSQVNI
jgi:hypothetical protein